MIIRLKDAGKTKYYRHTSGGKPILTSRGQAAKLPPGTAKTVLEHLRVIDARFKEAELVAE